MKRRVWIHTLVSALQVVDAIPHPLTSQFFLILNQQIEWLPLFVNADPLQLLEYCQSVLY